MSAWALMLASEPSLSAWEYAQRFPQVFLAALLFGFVCPLVGSYLLLRRMTMLALALPQLCMAGIACGIFCAPWSWHPRAAHRLTIHPRATVRIGRKRRGRHFNISTARAGGCEVGLSVIRARSRAWP